MRRKIDRFQLWMLGIAAAALIAFYMADIAQLAQATFTIVRDLKAQSEATAAKVSSLMEPEEGE